MCVGVFTYVCSRMRFCCLLILVAVGATNPGPDLYSLSERLSDSNSVLQLETRVASTQSSTVWTVVGAPLLIKYQVHSEGEEFFELAREFAIMRRIAHLRITPKVYYLSGSSPVSLNANEKVANFVPNSRAAFILMEKLEGKTLFELSDLSESEIARIGIQMVNIIRILHDLENIVHGDIHARNWIINPATNEIKLIDFGRARFALPATMGLPRPNHMLYSPWEQIGFPRGKRDDVFRIVFILAQFVVGKDELANDLTNKPLAESVRLKLRANLFRSSLWETVMTLAQTIPTNARPPYEAIIEELNAIILHTHSTSNASL